MDEDRKPKTDGPRVVTFASKVLEQVSRNPSHARHARAENFAEWLADAVIRPDYNQAAVLAEQAKLRMTTDDLILHSVPRAAAILGHRWACNRTGFAHVSIGSARLFGLCRSAVPEWSLESPVQHGASFLLVTPEIEDHLIGTSVLTYRLRQSGYSVRCLTQLSAAEIVDELDNGRFDCLLLSCSTAASLETVQQTVRHLRTSACVQPMIVLGGGVVHQSDGLMEKTGVDLATNDISTVLALLETREPEWLRGAAE